jgi:hypothetical protein
MANRTASIVVPGTVDGKRVNWSLKRAKQQGLIGSYWIKWRKGDNKTWDGPHKDEWTAKAAKTKREREFKLIALGVPATATKSYVTLAEAIAAFVLERPVPALCRHGFASMVTGPRLAISERYVRLYPRLPRPLRARGRFCVQAIGQEYS